MTYLPTNRCIPSDSASMIRSKDCSTEGGSLATCVAMVHHKVLLEISLLLEVPVSSIRLNTSFVQMGGNSLSAMVLARACRSRGIDLRVEAILSSPSIWDLLQLGLELSTSKDMGARDGQNLRPICSHDITDTIVEPATPITLSNSPYDIIPYQGRQLQPPIPCARVCPITEMQLALIYGNRSNPTTNTIQYYETYACNDIPTIKRAWHTVIDSEPIFRTDFVLHENKGILVEREKAHFVWSEVIASNLEEYEARITESHSETSIKTSFQVVTLPTGSHGNGKSTIVWRVHHALIDGFSSKLVISKLRAATRGMPIPEGPSFARVAGELDAYQARSQEARRLFWKRVHEKHPTATGELVLASPMTYPGGTNNIPAYVTFMTPLDKISAHAQKVGITPASVYHAAWALTLSMYVGSETVVFGTVLSGRNLPIAGVENVVGPLINILPFHIKLNGAAKTVDYLHQTFSHWINIMALQCSLPHDGFSRNFSSTMAIQLQPPVAGVPGRNLLSQPYSRLVSDVPLYILVEADGAVHLNYHSETYEKSLMASLGKSFCDAIISLMIPHDTVSMCLEKLLSGDIRSCLNKFGNCSSSLSTALPVKEDLVSLFEKVTAQFPNASAVERGTEILSYDELNRKASRVAQYLSSFIKRNEVVCVHADRSIQWIIAIYGILKAGGIYCPFDESWPAEIRDSNFEAGRGRLFLATRSSCKQFRPKNCAMCTSVEDILQSSCTEGAAVAFQGPRYPIPHTNAYLCFTSGSSGVPKGVICRHESLVALQTDLEVRLFASPGRKIAQIMSPAFDGSIHEIFSTLSYGATLILASKINPLDPLNLADSAILTPSIAQFLNPRDYPNLSAVYLVGETLSQNTNDLWSTCKMLYNMYGPTEATCGATIKRLQPNQPVTIGKPNPSMRLYILDTRQRLLPPGVIGEIYLAGIQISEGYIGRPMETQYSFMQDSISKNSSYRMYRTGDYGYWRHDGDLICLGRKDRQIKLRGYRIDLNDLQTRMLKAAPYAKAVAVVHRRDCLLAMIQPSSLDISAFRARIVNFLPAHAIPRHILAVDEFPLTAAGKVDYATIAKTEVFVKNSLKATSQDYVLIAVTDIWREVLDLAPGCVIDKESSFIDHGGHSIQQMLLSSKLGAKFGRHVTLRMVLEHPILIDLVKEIQTLGPSTLMALPKQPLDEHELSSTEKDWWEKYEMCLGSSAFNLNLVCKIGKEVDLDKLTFAWNTILARHRILSCRYTKYRRSGVRRVFAEHPPQVERVSVIDIWQEINRPFDLRLGSLITVSISADYMLLRISHIICDLTTLRTLLCEVASVYHEPCLSEIGKVFTESLAKENQIPSPSLDFWSNYLANLPREQYSISKLRMRDNYGGASEVCKVSEAVFHQIIQYTAREKVTFHQMSLAATALALQHDPKSHDIVLGAPHLNRNVNEDMKTIGLFLEPLPIRIRHDSAQLDSGSGCTNGSSTKSASEHGSGSFIRSVQSSSQAALSHAIPWTELLRHLQIHCDFPENPLFSVMVTFHDDREENTSALPGCQTLYTWTEGAKFSLMAEFMAVSQDTLMLRIEYDTGCFKNEDIKLLQGLVVTALRVLVTGASYEDMKNQMRTARDKNEGWNDIERRETKDFFAMELDKL